MTPQHPAAPETETDANGLTEAECNRLTNFLEFYTRGAESVSGLVEEVAGIVAERVRVVEGERDAEVTEAEREHEKTLAIMEAACDRSDAATLRAESAEAAHEAEKAAHAITEQRLVDLARDMGTLRAEVEALAERVDEPMSGTAWIALRLRSLLGGGEAR